MPANIKNQSVSYLWAIHWLRACSKPRQVAYHSFKSGLKISHTQVCCIFRPLLTCAVSIDQNLKQVLREMVLWCLSSPNPLQILSKLSVNSFITEQNKRINQYESRFKIVWKSLCSSQNPASTDPFRVSLLHYSILFLDSWLTVLYKSAVLSFLICQLIELILKPLWPISHITFLLKSGSIWTWIILNLETNNSM